MASSRPDEEKPRLESQLLARRPPAAMRCGNRMCSGPSFLALAASVVNSLEKSVQAICEGRFDLISEVKDEEEDSDRREVQIEQECLRILALYEPVASDLRRMATVLKVNRDWERIADLALRVARRARKLSRQPAAWPMPEGLKQLARDVLVQVRASYQALASRDIAAARARHRRRRRHRRAVPDAAQAVQGRSEPAPRAA